MRISVMLPIAAALLTPICSQGLCAEENPDFWNVATGAASEARRKPQIAAILLGGAMDYARQHDQNGVRPSLTQYQLLHAYVAIDKFDTYKQAYGNPGFRLDAGQFDPELAGYLTVVRNLADDCDKRGQDKTAKLGPLQQAALGRCARDFSAIEVAMRKKIAAENSMGLADALSLQGLYYSHFDLAKSEDAIISAYSDAIALFEAARKERNALDGADREFSMARRGDENDPGAVSSSAGEAAEFDVGSSTEPYVPFVMMRVVAMFAQSAIEEGRAADAQKFIDLTAGTLQHARNLHDFMARKWPCHLGLGLVYYWTGHLHAMRFHYTRKFDKDAGAKADADFREATRHFDRMLLLFKYSQGPGSNVIRNLSGSYLALLKANGDEAGAKKVEESMSEPLATATSGAAASASGCPLTGASPGEALAQ